MIDIDIHDNIITVDTDDPSFGGLFKYKSEEGSFNVFKGRFEYHSVSRNVYDSCRKIGIGWRYKFKIGWSMLIYNMYINKLGPDNIKKLIGTLYSSRYRTKPFPNLKSYQNEDVLHILKYKMGLYQVYTSYGKTETIATLVNYIYLETNDNVLLLVPSKKCRDELVKRCSEKFNICIPSSDGRIDLIVTSGVGKSKKYSDPEKLKETSEYLKKFDWLLADEVEYVMSPGGKKVLDLCTNVKYKYGFSGTADKTNGEMINFSCGLTKVVTNNSSLIGYFGQALIFRMPNNLEVNLVSIKTSCFYNLEFTESDFSNDENIYLNVLTKTWTNDEVCKFITSIIPEYPMLFIPINNLSNIISNWIDNYWRNKFRILLISGEGYIYYGIDENPIKVNLSEACKLINDKVVDVIPSTSSGYRALDLPGLTNILLIQGKVAGVVLQSVGRVARGKVTNIIRLDPTNSKFKIPVYSKGADSRESMIKNYYKYCKINNITRYEHEFL